MVLKNTTTTPIRLKTLFGTLLNPNIEEDISDLFTRNAIYQAYNELEPYVLNGSIQIKISPTSQFLNPSDGLKTLILVSQYDLSLLSQSGLLPPYYYIESDVDMNVTGSAFVTYLTLPLNITQNGLYRLSWGLTWSHNNNASDIIINILLNTSILNHYQIEPKNTDSNTQRIPLSGFKSLQLNTGSYSLLIQFKPEISHRRSTIYTGVLEAQLVG